jgi:hypothetical protein
MRSNELAVAGRTVALGVSVLACASSSGGRPARPDRVENVSIESQTESSNITLRPDVYASKASLEAPAARAWAVLPTAYNALPIPLERLDSAHRYVSGSAMGYRRFLGRPLSQFVDCGTTIVGPSADSYNVYLRIESEVDSATASTSTLRTTVYATGSSGGGSNIRCTSTGALEKQIAEQVKELLADRK